MSYNYETLNMTRGCRTVNDLMIINMYTLDFEILLDKSAHFGVLGKANSLIRSYLMDRKQIVVYENTQSILLIVKPRVL